MAYPADVCPHCGVLLSGVRCQACGYTDSKAAFVANNHHCPKCGSVVHVGGTSAAATRPLVTHFGAFFRRLAATIVDFIVVGVPLSALALLLGAVGVSSNARGAVYSAYLACVWIYSSVMESSALQGTLGKLALRLKVTDMEGKKASLGRATVRNLSKFLSAMIFYVGFLMIAFTDKEQGLHDKIAKCLVVPR